MTIQMVRAGTMFPTPSPEPLFGRLLDAATVIEGVDFVEPSALFESFNCIVTDSKAAFPCPVVTLAAPTSSAPSTATTGGTLPVATYRAKITAVNSRGETVASTEQSQVTTGTTSTVTFNWGAVAGATTYRVYLTNGATNTEAVYVEKTASPYILTAWPPASSVAGAPPTTNTAVSYTAKSFTGPSWQDGIRFSVYAGFTCKAIGWDDDEQTEVTKAFQADESTGVERALLQTRFVANGTVWAAATDLTPAGGAVDPTVGLALLENDASCYYGGAPTIHVPRGIGTLLTRNGTVAQDGRLLRSVQGSKIASGGGYGCPNSSPTGAAPAAGEQWIYASGEVVVARSQIVAQTQMDRGTNDMYVLVERLYVAAVDCYTSAVKVKVA